jgi:hypothetical protein
MKIRMRTTLTVFADGIRGELLAAGSIADLPELLAMSLAKDGDAEPVEEAGNKMLPPHENKMLPPPENKAAYRRRSREG